MAKDSGDRAGSDELAIFINDEEEYRILIPNDWADERQMPELAYLSVAAVLRLAHPAEKEFARSVAAWAEANLKKKNGDQLELIPAKKKQKPN